MDILRAFAPGQEWTIRKPQAGWRKESYIAANERDRYFLKFDVPIELLKRLGDLGVAPRVVSSGRRGGRSFVIQEFVNGIHPESRAWMRHHLDELVAIIRTYHDDPQLAALLARLDPTDFVGRLSRDLTWLSGRFSGCGAAYLRTRTMQAGFQRLIEAANTLEAAPLTPIHNDPSPTNILFAEGRFVFLDWDEVTLSDPLRDIGLLLWWNFPPSQWPAFFEKYGLSLEAARLAKIYWFAARASLDIALWHAEHSLDGRSFAADFLAALDQQPNPQGY